MSTQPKISVPLLDLKAQYATLRDEIRIAMDRVMDSQYFILGPEVLALEKEIAAYSQCSYGVGVSSGTDALLVALMALDIQSGDEVVTTPYTFFATAGVIHRVGAKPVFVDIEPDTYNLDPQRIESAITPNTKAIIPVHLYGQCAEMTPILDVARRYRIPVIEDAAQAIGAEYQNHRAGSMGTMGCFSFFPSKNLGGFGDGGMVVTNDDALYEKLIKLRMHGSHPKYYHSLVGGNFRLDALQATVVRVKLHYLDRWTEARQANAQRYNELFESAGLTKELVQLPRIRQNRHIFNQYVIQVENRDGLLAFLKEHDIGSEIYYPVPLHLQECFKHLGYSEGVFPMSEAAAKKTLALPIFPELTDRQQAFVVETIARFYSM